MSSSVARHQSLFKRRRRHSVVATSVLLSFGRSSTLLTSGLQWRCVTAIELAFTRPRVDGLVAVKHLAASAHASLSFEALYPTTAFETGGG